MLEEKVWTEKYRPKTIDECFLPSATKEYLNTIIKSSDIPSMFFSGSTGIGKTTVAMAIANQLDMECLKINASMNGNIDTIRNDVQQFSSTISFNGLKKIVIFDEADGLSAAAQQALRGFVDEFSGNVTFIFTANFRNKVIEPLISRLTEVSFSFDKKERPDLAKGLFVFLTKALKDNEIEYEPQAIQKFLLERLSRSSDIRSIIKDVQKLSFEAGKFTQETLKYSTKGELDELIGIINSKNFNDIRRWVGENSDIEVEKVFRHIYDNFKDLVKNSAKLPIIISIINDHQFKHAFVADKEINLVSALAEISATL